MNPMMNQYLGEMDVRFSNFEEDFGILIKEWQQTRVLLEEITRGLEDERSPWFAVDIRSAMHELYNRTQFRVQTVLGTLGGQEPKEIAAFLRKWRDARWSSVAHRIDQR